MLIKKQRQTRILLLGIASMIAAVGLLTTGFVVDTWLDQEDGRLLKLSQDQLQVVATMFPIADMAQHIVGDDEIVYQLIPNSVDPHTYSPTPEDILFISQADALIYLGDEQEPWVRSLLDAVNNPKLVVIDLGQLNFEHRTGVDQSGDMEEADQTKSDRLINLDVEEKHSQDDEQGRELEQAGAVEHGEHDHSDEFHYWLDFELAQRALQIIAQELSEATPELSERFSIANKVEQTKWAELDEKYRLGLQNCQTRTVVYAGHSAFGHVAEEYELSWLDALPVSPDAELAPQTLANLIQTLQSENSLAVFTDAFFSPKLAETIAEESGLPTLRLNTGERQLFKNGQNPASGLVEIMEANLGMLQEGLGC